MVLVAEGHVLVEYWHEIGRKLSPRTKLNVADEIHEAKQAFSTGRR